MISKNFQSSHRFVSQRRRQHVLCLNFDYERLEPRQLLAAVHDHVDPSVTQQNTQFLGDSNMRSFRVGNGPSHSFQQNDDVHSFQLKGVSQLSVNAPQNNDPNNRKLLNNRNEFNSQSLQNQPHFRIPALRENQATSSQIQSPSQSNTTLISGSSRLVVTVGATTSLKSPLQNPSYAIYGQSDRIAINDSDEDSNKLRQLTMPLSNSEIGALSIEIETEEIVSSRLDEFFAALNMDVDIASKDGFELTSELSLLDSIARERKSLRGILSQLEDLVPFNSEDNTTESENRGTREEFREPPLKSRTQSETETSVTDQDASRISATSAGDHSEFAFNLAKIADGGMVMLTVEEMAAVDQIDWMIDFVEGQQESVEASVNGAQIEMSVGVVQAFDLGRRENSSNIKESSVLKSAAE